MMCGALLCWSIHVINQSPLTHFSLQNSPTPGPNRVMGGSEDSDGPSTLKAATKEEELVSALGITMMDCHMENGLKKPPTDQHAGRDEHVVVPDPHADDADLSDVRGIKAPTKGPQEICKLSTLYIHSSRINHNHLTI